VSEGIDVPARIKELSHDILDAYPGTPPKRAKSFIEFALGVRRLTADADMSEAEEPITSNRGYSGYLRAMASFATGCDEDDTFRLTGDEWLVVQIINADLELTEQGV